MASTQLMKALACVPMLGPLACVGAEPGPAAGRPPPPQGVHFAQFDPDVLRRWGLDPGVADYFRLAPRFTAGEQPVQVTVNGAMLGRRSARFDAAGELCFGPAFIDGIGLLPMPDAMGPGSGSCPDYRVFSPRTVITLQPSMGAVDITVPPEHALAASRILRTESGGVGGLFNYRAFALNSRFPGAASASYRYADTVAGLNAGNWIFRSQQNVTGIDGRQRGRWVGAYVQRSFPERRQVLQAGRITTQDALFAGVPLTGAQWFPERALASADVYAVTGIAGSRARVEIRQNGALLLQTMVPPGPFRVTDYPLQNRGVDLQVKVVEDSGVQQEFGVPAAQLLLAADNAVQAGLSVSAGTLRDPGDLAIYRRTAVASISQGWAAGGISGIAGTLLSHGYALAGTALDARFAERRHAVFAQLLATREEQPGRSGVQGSGAVVLRLADNASLGFSGNMRTRDFRSLQEAQSLDRTPWLAGGYRSQLGGTLSWTTPDVGSFGGGLTRERYATGSAGSFYNLSWSGSWKGANLSLGVARNAARNVPADPFDPLASGRLPGNTYLFVHLGIPFGGNAGSTSFSRHSQGTTWTGTAIDQRLNDTLNWRASTERASSRQQGTTNALSASLLPLYASLSAGMSHAENYSSTYAEASGAVVAAAGGVALSPAPVQDTFGTVTLGDVAGIRVDTPYGPVWSGPGGVAPLPGLAPFHESRIEVAGKSLPLDVEVDNGLQVVQAGRGAVVNLDLGVRRVRRLMLTVTLANGSALPAGAAVLRGENEFFTSAAANGRVLVTDMKEGDALRAELPDGTRCELRDLHLSPRSGGELFQAASARCL